MFDNRFRFEYSEKENKLVTEIENALKETGIEPYFVEGISHTPHYDYVTIIVRKHKENDQAS